MTEQEKDQAAAAVARYKVVQPIRDRIRMVADRYGVCPRFDGQGDQAYGCALACTDRKDWCERCLLWETERMIDEYVDGSIKGAQWIATHAAKDAYAADGHAAGAVVELLRLKYCPDKTVDEFLAAAGARDVWGKPNGTA